MNKCKLCENAEVEQDLLQKFKTALINSSPYLTNITDEQAMNNALIIAYKQLEG